MMHEEHLLNVMKIAMERREDEVWFREAICLAHADGVPVVALAKAAGVSRPTIYATLKRGSS